MMLQIFVAMGLGIFLGTVAGLLPGLHINLVAAILFSYVQLMTGYFSFFEISVIIVAMTASQIFFDFIPSIFLGAPEESTVMSILPGHALLLRGEGLAAFRLAMFGCMFGLVGVVLVSPLLVIIIPHIFSFLQPYIGYFLIMISFFVILAEKSFPEKVTAFCIFIISGLLGIVVFSLDISEPLLPLLTGLFGVSTLIKSLIDDVVIPAQRDSGDLPVGRDAPLSLLAGIFSGSIMSIFPAVGPAQSAIVARSFFRKMESGSYLVLLGCIASVSSVFSLITLYTISKARNGSIVVLSQIMTLDKASLYGLLAVMLFAGGISAILALNFARYFCSSIKKVNYRLISLCTIIFTSVLVLLFSGFTGLLVLFTSASIGTLAVSAGVGRHNVMGCLMIPVIFYYF